MIVTSTYCGTADSLTASNMPLLIMLLHQEKPFPIPKIPEEQKVLKNAKDCVVCGGKFKVSSESPRAKTCSRECSDINRRSKTSTKKVPARAVYSFCTECGARFEQFYRRVVTCSDDCTKQRNARMKRERRRRLSAM